MIMASKNKIKKVAMMMFKNLSFFLLIQLLSMARSQGIRLIGEQARALPIQMDMKTDGDITICTGLKRYIACRDGSNIAITNAFWGRTSDKICPSDDGDPVTDCDGSDDTLTLVKSYCEAKNECNLEAKHTKLQKNGTHHCPGVNKYLIVNYTCMPESKGVTLCDSAETTLSCSPGWTMELADIFWGRRASTKYCGTEEGMECDSSEFAAKDLKNKCNGKRKCLVRADSAVLDNQHSPCSGMLKYLMVNYVCRPPTTKTDETDEEDTKILQDTSSKELMGLLEKHLNEIKTPDGKESKQTQPSSDEKKEKVVEVKQYGPHNKPSAAASAKSKTRTTVVRTNPSFVATEDDDITSSLLNGPAFTRSLKKQDVTLTGLNKEESAQHASVLTRREDVESPAADIKATQTSTKEQEKLPFGSAVEHKVKDTVPKTKPDESYEVTEPNTVRSILARAKEVLKTLDSDTATDSEIAKRGAIARSAKRETKLIPDEKFANETVDAVKQVAKLAQSLVTNVATKAIKGKKSNKVQETAAVAVQRPKPGPQKHGLRATGPGTAGIGNTP